jgi:hypothetical protein
MAKKDKKNETETPQVNKDLSGFDVQINEFGEIVSTFDINKLNEFLDDNTSDKKFKGVEVVRRQNDEGAGDTNQKNWG